MAADRSRRERRRVHLYIAVLGIRGAWQVMRETEDALRRCRRVFLLAFAHKSRYLRAVCSDVVDLSYLYEEEKPRWRAYDAVAEAVLHGARAGHRRSPSPCTDTRSGHKEAFKNLSLIAIKKGREP